MTESDSGAYWESRLRKDFTLGGVGYIGLGEPFNRWLYRVRRRRIIETLTTLAVARKPSVLDIGSGTGFMIQTWQEAGAADIHGCDLTEVAVERLTSQFPSFTFSQLDVGADEFPYRTVFDAISANDVLFHITDDDAYRRAVNNIFQALKPGGYFIFTDFFPRGETIRAPHQVSRSNEDITSLLSGAGFQIIDRQPVFVLMNNPMKGGRALRAWWWCLRRVVGLVPWAGGPIGAVLMYPELFLCKYVRRGPSTELMVCRRPPVA
jgi:SAM-dependent methyltransferase